MILKQLRMKVKWIHLWNNPVIESDSESSEEEDNLDEI